MRWWWTGFWEQMNLQDFTSCLRTSWAPLCRNPPVCLSADEQILSDHQKRRGNSRDHHFTSVDSGGAERDWKLYRKQKSKTYQLHTPLTVLHCCLCRALLGHTVIQASDESELRLRQTSLLLQTHLMRLHSLSQLLEIFLSLLECLLHLLQLLLQDKPHDSESHRKLLALNHHVNRRIQEKWNW